MPIPASAPTPWLKRRIRPRGRDVPCVVRAGRQCSRRVCAHSLNTYDAFRYLDAGSNDHSSATIGIGARQKPKLNEHAPLAEERRKVWQKVDALIEDFVAAKAKCSMSKNPSAKVKLLEVRSRVLEMTQRSRGASATPTIAGA